MTEKRAEDLKPDTHRVFDDGSASARVVRSLYRKGYDIDRIATATGLPSAAVRNLIKPEKRGSP